MFKKLFKAMQRSQMRRVEYWQLHNMSDQMLKDIGITRGEIRDKLYKQENVNRQAGW